MIKKLDILIIRSFIGPFIVTFFITLFVLVMQFFWLYMDELLGKGLGIGMIMQLLFYMSTTMVPLALPLSILLASIMTFGTLGENFELVAIKSSGISLLRFLRPLFLLIVVIGGLAFLFNNNAIPVANLKALSLLYDMRNSKPTLNIRPDQFNNDLDGFSIRVGSKDEDGKTIHDIIIYDQSLGMGNTRVVLAKKGQMLPGTDKQSLIFRLEDGWQYDEGVKNGNPSQEQTRMHFDKWDKVFNLSAFTRTNQDMFKNAYQMMNVSQLATELDSIKHTQARQSNTVVAYLIPYITLLTSSKDSTTLAGNIAKNTAVKTYDSSFLRVVKDSLRATVIKAAINSVQNAKNLIAFAASDRKIENENYIKYVVEWHRKFTLSFACILLFLVGAPLGAIIRKGGIGMPLVIAVAFFVVFHITTMTGEKLAKTGALAPWMGMWMATGMLLPIAFWLISKARNDSQIFSKDLYIRVWKALKRIFTRNKEHAAVKAEVL